MAKRIFAVFLILAVFWVNPKVNSQEPSKKPFKSRKLLIRSDVNFKSQGLECNGWFYLPVGLKPGEKVPAIVTANALLAEKDFILPSYAERFAVAGFATLVFDYRFFGESAGEPRHHLVPYEMLQDIRNAITWLASQPEVDPDRIGGFGISLGGGHMLHLAAFERRLRAVVATASKVSGTAAFEYQMDRGTLQQILTKIGQDRVERYKTGSPATYRKAFGSSGEKTLFTEEEVYNYYVYTKQVFTSDFDNMLTVQSLENLIEYNPTSAIHLASPTAVLFIHAQKDFIPVSLISEVYGRAIEPKKLVVLDCFHTELYDDEGWITKAADEAIAWFDKYLVLREKK